MCTVYCAWDMEWDMGLQEDMAWCVIRKKSLGRCVIRGQCDLQAHLDHTQDLYPGNLDTYEIALGRIENCL